MDFHTLSPKQLKDKIFHYYWQQGINQKIWLFTNAPIDLTNNENFLVIGNTFGSLDELSYYYWEEKEDSIILSVTENKYKVSI